LAVAEKIAAEVDRVLSADELLSGGYINGKIGKLDPRSERPAESRLGREAGKRDLKK